MESLAKPVLYFLSDFPFCLSPNSPMICSAQVWVPDYSLHFSNNLRLSERAKKRGSDIGTASDRTRALGSWDQRCAAGRHRIWFDGEYLQKKLVFAITSQNRNIQCWSGHDSSRTGSLFLHACWHRGERRPGQAKVLASVPQQVLSLILFLHHLLQRPFSSAVNTWTPLSFRSPGSRGACAPHTSSSPDLRRQPRLHASTGGFLALIKKICPLSSAPRRRWFWSPSPVVQTCYPYYGRSMRFNRILPGFVTDCSTPKTKNWNSVVVTPSHLAHHGTSLGTLSIALGPTSCLS